MKNFCGLCTGKGRLRPLLDGHEKIITGPFQNLGFGILTNELYEFLKNYERRKKSIVHKTIDQENINSIFRCIKNQILDISISDFIIFLHKSGSGFTEILEYSLLKKLELLLT